MFDSISDNYDCTGMAFSMWVVGKISVISIKFDVAGVGTVRFRYKNYSIIYNYSLLCGARPFMFRVGILKAFMISSC